MGNYYTQNPDYRASTLDRDYSGLRGYDQMGQPNSQVGQFGLNPMGYTTPTFADPSNNSTTQRQFNQSAKLDNLVAQLPPDLQSPLNLGRGRGRSAASEDEGSWWDSITDFFTPDPEPQTYAAPTTGPAATPGGDVNNTMPGGSSSSGDYPSTNYPAINTNSDGQWVSGPGNTNPDGTPVQGGSKSDKPNDVPTTYVTPDGETTVNPQDIFNPDNLTPFQAYDRQRFAAPSDRTTQGENLLAGRINQSNPFAAAQSAARGAANYSSGFTPAALNLTGPTANTYSNVNQGLLAGQYGNANQGLTPAQNYSRNFQQNLAQFQDPYTNQVVDQTIQDLDRARRITNNDISGNAARAGAFGGSREALMRSENNRNFADRTAAAVGQLRSQGFQRAADRAQQEQLQRLGLTASDVQNLRGYQSAGNLQGQNISAQDVRDVRGLRSQGALTAQGLGAQSDRDAMSYANQLQMQGNQLGVEQARLAEQFRQGAGALNLQGAGALGNLGQMQTADERQRIADLLASGGAQDARNQQDLDFIYNEFNRELDYPGSQIDLRNAAISPATGSIVTTTQPRYEQSPLAGPIGTGLTAYGVTKNPYIALALAGYDLFS
jgi:hypothetical protein